MKKTSAILVLALAGVVSARDTKMMMPIAKAMESADYKAKVGDKIKFSFGDTAAAAAGKSLGVAKTSRKTNAVGKSDSAACEWVFLSAMIALRGKAESTGADQVVGIVSNYKNVEYASPTEYECHVGGVIAGVALKGTLVKGR
ncbi:MAG TPA: excinuclease ATPase subunit [Fibrobacteria bacterium]|nr:excinuclease ATPase subunit [Fibrobacteria bacterium]